MELKWLVWYESKSWQSFVGSVGFSLFFFLHKTINAESIICLLAAVQVGIETNICGYGWDGMEVVWL